MSLLIVQTTTSILLFLLVTIYLILLPKHTIVIIKMTKLIIATFHKKKMEGITAKVDNPGLPLSWLCVGTINAVRKCVENCVDFNSMQVYTGYLSLINIDVP